jgi:hypothetical protein
VGLVWDILWMVVFTFICSWTAIKFIRRRLIK